MSDMTDEKNARFQAWLEKLCNRHLPKNHISRVKTFARELAEGFFERYWSKEVLFATGESCLSRQACEVYAEEYASFLDHHSGSYPEVTDTEYFPIFDELPTQESDKEDFYDWRGHDYVYELSKNGSQGRLVKYPNIFQLTKPSSEFGRAMLYLKRRWNFDWPDVTLLMTLSFIDKDYSLTRKAVALVSEAQDSDIFISYSRKQSSAFALLLHTWLNSEGYSTFIDKELNAGAQWEATLRKRIEGCDYMILILGKESLPSENILNEIKWAVEFKVKIIPIWHHSYVFELDRQYLPEELFNAVNQLHALPIAEENPLYYETAIRGLINRLSLGITPD